MKELLFNTNGRPRALEDLVMLQDQSKTLRRFFGGLGNFIISGCTVSVSINGGYTINEGLAFISGRVHTFPGVNVAALPIQLVSNGGAQLDQRNDKTGNPHYCAVEYLAVAQPLNDTSANQFTPKVRLIAIGSQDYYTAVRSKLGLAASSPTNWANLAMEPGTVVFGDGSTPPQWRRDALGMVHLRGNYVVNENPDGGYYSFFLPVGARPSRMWDVNTTTSTVNIYPDGRVMQSVSSRGGVWLLDGVSFLAEN